MTVISADKIDASIRDLAAEVRAMRDELSERRLDEKSLAREDRPAFSLAVPKGQGQFLPTGVRKAKPPLPPPELINGMIARRELRNRYFESDLFSDPAWNMILDLAAAEGEGRRVSVSSLCIASGVAPTTALRWIGQMVDKGLLVRTEDEIDRRRVFVSLSHEGKVAFARYFSDLQMMG